jgi:hypothetical protein
MPRICSGATRRRTNLRDGIGVPAGSDADFQFTLLKKGDRRQPALTQDVTFARVVHDLTSVVPPAPSATPLYVGVHAGSATATSRTGRQSSPRCRSPASSRPAPSSWARQRSVAGGRSRLGKRANVRRPKFEDGMECRRRRPPAIFRAPRLWAHATTKEGDNTCRADESGNPDICEFVVK